METKTITVEMAIEQTIKDLNRGEISKDDKEILSQVRGFIDVLKGTAPNSKNFEDYEPMELSKLAGSLALLKVNLAEIISKAGKNMRLTESKIKLRKGNLRFTVSEMLKKKNIKPTGDNIKAEIDRQIFKLSIKRDFLEEHYEKALYVWRSVNSVLDVTSQQINIKVSQKSDTGYLEDSVDIVPADIVPQTGEIKS